MKSNYQILDSVQEICCGADFYEEKIGWSRQLFQHVLITSLRKLLNG